MGKICWDFPILGNGNKTGSNIAAIQMFKGAGIMDGLAREVCQNSLDNKLESLPEDAPVKLDFKLIFLKQSEYKSVFDGYREALFNAKLFWENNPLKTPDIMSFIDNLISAVNKDPVPVLVMGDRNTTGLRGVNVDPDLEKSFWDLMVNTDGISIKPNDNSAGSYGIGKNAPFAYSALNLIFYNTLADDGGRAFEGVSRILTTQVERNGKMHKTMPIGKYLYLIDEDEGRPILPSDNSKIANLDVFNRSENDYGTDVAIVGFNTDLYENWEEATTIAFIKNFILALYKGKLEVTITSPTERYEIKEDTLKDLLFDTFKNDSRLKITRQIYETLSNPDKIIPAKIAEENDLTIYVKYNDYYLQSFSRFRTTGMLINTTTSDVYPHFSVVVVVNKVGENKLDVTLRASEPPQHSEWKAKNITDNTTLRNRASKYIREIGKQVKAAMEDYENNNIDDSIDAGIGSYLPDNGMGNQNSANSFKKEIKIKEIKTRAGETIFKREYSQGDSATGQKIPGAAVLAGTKRHIKRVKKKINVVKPGDGNDKGVAEGSGNVIFTKPVLEDSRNFGIAKNRYRTVVLSPCEYDKIYVQYYAGRDYDGDDETIIKNIKINEEPARIVNNTKFGPFKIKKGLNLIHVEYEERGKIAATPEFFLEVTNEK